MSDVPIKVVCRCASNGGRLCDPCAEREIERLIAQTRAEDPEYDRQATSLPGWPPRLEGRDRAIGGVHSLAVRRKPQPVKEPWSSISERLSALLESDEALDALAEKLNNPAA